MKQKGTPPKREREREKYIWQAVAKINISSILELGGGKTMPDVPQELILLVNDI